MQIMEDDLEVYSHVDLRRKDCLFVFDSNYIYPFFVSLFSLLNNSGPLNKVMIAYDNAMLLEKCRSDISSFCRDLGIDLEFIKVKLEGNLPISKGFNTSTYAKLFAISEISKPYVYFDVDTLFVRNLDEIWNSSSNPENKHAISARTDPGILLDNSRNQAVLISKGRYFNAGVMVVNPSQWKHLGYNSSLASVISNYDSLGFEWLDQCVFNYIVAGNYSNLPNKFNFFVGEDLSLQDISVFHFAGSHKKPWRIPQAFFHRFLYLRLKIFTKPYCDYLKYEKNMILYFKHKNYTLSESIREYRKIEFAKAPHLIDLLLYKFESGIFGGLVKVLHGFLTAKRSHKL